MACNECRGFTLTSVCPCCDDTCHTCEGRGCADCREYWPEDPAIDPEWSVEDLETAYIERGATIEQLRAELADKAKHVWVVARNGYTIGTALSRDGALQMLTGGHPEWECMHRSEDGDSWWQHRGGAKGEIVRWEVRDV